MEEAPPVLAIAVAGFFVLLNQAVAVYDKRVAPRLERRANELLLYPYVMFRIRPNISSPVITTNRFALRGPEPARLKPAGVVRLAGLGGPACFGEGASDDAHTFVRAPEAKLNPVDRDRLNYHEVSQPMSQHARERMAEAAQDLAPVLARR